MAFTPITVQATRQNADNTPASGNITFTLNAEMLNGIDSVQPAPILGVLNANGQLVAQNGQPLILLANDDTGTTPNLPTAAYLVTEQIDGSPLVQYSVIISSGNTSNPLIIDFNATFTEGSPIVQLSNVLASSALQFYDDANNSLSGDVIAFDPVANTVTIDQDAAFSGTSDDFQLYYGVDLSTLTQYEPAPTIQSYIPFTLPGGQTDGQVPTWNDTDQLWEAGTGGGDSGIVLVLNQATLIVPGPYGDSSLAALLTLSTTPASALGFWTGSYTSPPLLVPPGQPVCFSPFLQSQGFDSTNDGWFLAWTIIVTDILGLNLIDLAANLITGPVGPGQEAALDPSTATIVQTIGSDLSWSIDNGWSVASELGGIYVVTMAYQAGYY